MPIPLRCSICLQPAQNPITNGYGELYCARHSHELPSCYSCGRPIGRLTGGGLPHDDGRHVCNICRRKAVDSNSAAQVVLHTVRKGLAQIGLDIQHPEIKPSLADRAALAHVGQRYGMGAMLFDGLTETLQHEDGRRSIGSLFVLSGLPAEHCALIMAHEIGHAWLFLHGFPKLPLLVEEGICELWAAQWLHLQATPFAKHRLQVLANNPDPVYGAGYRAALAGLRSRSLPGLLEYVRRKAALPGG